MWTNDRYDEFVDLLHRKHPEMFSQPYGGVAVYAGWWPIIEALCANIQSYINWKTSVSERYPDTHSPCPAVVVTQIKEKFGGLRFYYDGGDEYVRGLVTMAESWASSACETCGEPGERRTGGWIRTLCDVHEAERQQQTLGAE